MGCDAPVCPHGRTSGPCQGCRLDAARAEAASLRETIKNIEAANWTGLQAELHQAKAEWFEEKKRAREAEVEVERLQEENRQLRDRLDFQTEYRNEVDRLTAQARDALTSQLALQDEVERLTNENLGLRAHAEAADDECERLRAGWQKDIDNAERLAVENERLRALAVSDNDAIVEWQRAYEQLQEVMSYEESKVHEAEQLKARSKGLEKVIERLRTKNNRLVAEAAKWETAYQGASAERDTLRKHADSFDRQVETVQELEAEVERLQADAAYGRTAMDNYGVVQQERDAVLRDVERLRNLLERAVDDIGAWREAARNALAEEKVPAPLPVEDRCKDCGVLFPVRYGSHPTWVRCHRNALAEEKE